MKQVLLSTGSSTLAESSKDPYWGTGVHLHSKNALDKCFWTPGGGGGAMSEILEKVRHELSS